MPLLRQAYDAVKTELPCWAKCPTTNSKDSNFCHFWWVLLAGEVVKGVVLTGAPCTSECLIVHRHHHHEDCLWDFLSICQPRIISGA